MQEKPLNIAILTGGPSAERGIALASAAFVEEHLSTDKYRSRTILVESDGWYDRDKGVAVDRNDFSLTIDENTLKFDFVFLIIHGTPAEDGKLQGYFESLGIPHSTCNTLTAALTFNKQWCKLFLRQFDVPMAWSQVVPVEDIASVDPAQFSYPLFVKPNNNGSSYGVTRVNTAENLSHALRNAAQYDHEIMIETFLAGREFSCGGVRDGKTIHIFPLTEIIPEGEFFDYKAKYEGASREVTPADLPAELSEDCQALSRMLYSSLQCRGLVRFDYILSDHDFYLLEVNTIPGLSPASIVPQQARAYGWTMEHMLEVVIRDCMATPQSAGTSHF